MRFVSIETIRAISPYSIKNHLHIHLGTQLMLHNRVPYTQRKCCRDVCALSRTVC